MQKHLNSFTSALSHSSKTTTEATAYRWRYGGLSLKLIAAGERAGCLGFRFTPASTQKF